MSYKNNPGVSSMDGWGVPQAWGFGAGACMQIDELIAKLEALCSSRPQRVDESWAYRCCVTSREAHETVCALRPPRRRVRDEIIPLLNQLCEAISEVLVEGDPRKSLTAIAARNIGLRIGNLMRYVDGKPSEFDPGAKFENGTQMPTLEEVAGG